jgi:hypothetical protein
MVVLVLVTVACVLGCSHQDPASQYHGPPELAKHLSESGIETTDSSVGAIYIVTDLTYDEAADMLRKPLGAAGWKLEDKRFKPRMFRATSSDGKTVFALVDNMDERTVLLTQITKKDGGR